jgi:hypothetical protein
VRAARLERLQAAMREREAKRPKFVYRPREVREVRCWHCRRSRHELCDGETKVGELCECGYCRKHLDVPRRKVANVQVGTQHC